VANPLASSCREIRRLSDSYAGLILVGGLAFAAVYNALRWPQDDARARLLRCARLEPPPEFLTTPRISIVAAAWNERELIGRHLQSVLALDYPNLEYVLCAGGDDGTYELASGYQNPRIRVLRQRPGEGLLSAINRCLAMASGEIVLFTDADSLIDQASFERALLPLINEDESVSTGAFSPLPEQRTSDFVRHRWAATMYRYFQAGKYVRGLSGANAAVSVSALRAIGGLPPGPSVGFDFRLAWHLHLNGYRIRFVHASVVQTQFETTFLSATKQRSRWLKGILLNAIQLHAWDQVAVVAVFYLVGLGMVALPLSAPILGRTPLAIWVASLTCATLNRVRYLRFAARALDAPASGATYLKAVVYVPRDLLGLAYAPMAVLFPRQRTAW
jgi:GT2 family glycosyltransferase